ncbi:MAG: Flavodoxin [Candidatus Bathyarchaeota archaeon B26-2]|nr:MAG: Flavodoxin [Candidatus Bathyarchaeota archaeon B26-2]
MAEEIAEGIRETEGMEVVIDDVEVVDLQWAVDYDIILIGSPNHLGGPARTIKRFIDNLSRLNLKAKWFAVFDTYLGGDFEKAVKKMEKTIKEKIPSLKRISPGLSIRVRGIKGPIVDGELPRCREFGRQIADQLKDRLRKGSRNKEI